MTTIPQPIPLRPKRNDLLLWVSLLALVLILPGFPHILFAEVPPTQDPEGDEELEALLSLDLEDLTMVSVASKRLEAINDAPGILAVVGKKEIRNFGALNLRDILNRQTSLQITGNHFVRNGRTSVRGVGIDHFDREVLVLLNGRPVREAGATGINEDIYAGFPVSSLERIEIIRGPGSVLYGTNAFAGVINLVTKSPGETPELSTSVGYGSYDRKQFTVDGGMKLGDAEVFVSGNLLNNSEAEVGGFTDQLGQRGDFPKGEETYQGVVTAQWRNLRLNTYVNTHTGTSLPLATPILPPVNAKSQRFFFDLGYTYDVNEDWAVSVNGLYHRHNVDQFFLFQGLKYNQDSRNLLSEITIKGQVTENLRILLGGIYDHQYGNNEIEPKVFLDDWNIINYNAYAQFEYQAWDWLRAVGGIQWNKRLHGDDKFSPRADLIANMAEGWNAKLSYGEAFRSPVGEELQNVVPPLGNPDLSAEKIRTIAAQVSFNPPNGAVALTYYRTWQKDLLQGTAVYENSGKIRYQGIELEGRYQPTSEWTLLGNMTYQTNKDQSGQADVTPAPIWMVKAGVTYASPLGASLSVFNSYFGPPTQNREVLSGVVEANPRAKGYSLLTANLILDLGPLSRRSSLEGVSVSIYGDNLLDEKIFFPNVRPQTFNTIPHHLGRGVYGWVTVDWAKVAGLF